MRGGIGEHWDAGVQSPGDFDAGGAGGGPETPPGVREFGENWAGDGEGCDGRGETFT